MMLIFVSLFPRDHDTHFHHLFLVAICPASKRLSSLLRNSPATLEYQLTAYLKLIFRLFLELDRRFQVPFLRQVNPLLLHRIDFSGVMKFQIRYLSFVLKRLIEREICYCFLFGGNRKDVIRKSELKKIHENSHYVCGKL